MSFILFPLAYVSLLTLPGLALTRVLKIRFNPAVSILALSYICFTLLFITANYFGISHHIFLLCVMVVLTLSLIYLVVLAVLAPTLKPELKSFSLPIVSISVISFLYQLVVGPYTEIPADLYAHLERFQLALYNVERGSLGDSLEVTQLLRQGSGVYYYLLATIASQTQTAAVDITNTIDFANRTLFLIAAFFFARFIFSNHRKRSLVAAFACLFIALHMGINVFAYIRYYSMAPGMLNFIIYMFAVSAFLWAIRQQSILSSMKAYLLVLLATISAAAIHVQEAMFIGVISALVCFVCMVSRVRFFRLERSYFNWQVVTFSLLAISLFVILYSTSGDFRAQNAHWRLWEFGKPQGALPQLSTLNLKKEFIQVVTLWGVFVYGLFFLNLGRYRNNPFILAGMILVPVFTFMNPFFVDLFLRHYNSTTLWRLSFLLPIHYVAADLTIYYLKEFGGEIIRKKVLSVFALSGMALLLFTPNTLVLGASYNRLSTLFPSTTGVDSRHYVDLITFMNALDGRRTVLTDPMTGYLISGLSSHYSNRRKFFRNYSYIHFTFENYHDNPLDRYVGNLLIVNLRKKELSKVGKLSNHWSYREWFNIEQYYPKQLLEHLDTRPGKFKKIWSANGATIYEIQE